MKNSKNKEENDRIRKILTDERQITETLQRAIRETVERHKREGNPLVSWENGKVVWIKP